MEQMAAGPPVMASTFQAVERKKQGDAGRKGGREGRKEQSFKEHTRIEVSQIRIHVQKTYC